MIQGNVFKPWVPNWLIILVLVFCMLHSMVLLGVYTSNITYSASFLDVEVEDLQFSLCVTYGTFLATILIESRLFKFFPTKKYFVTIYGLAAITFILSAYTDNFSLFIVLRMVEGVLMALPWIPLRQLLITRFQSKNAVILGFTFNYGTLLLASPFIMNIAVWLLENYDWKYMAYGSAMFQIICVGLVMLTFNENRFHKKIPLYQVDWSSYILVLTAILSGAFVFIYGEKLYWFDSIAIKAAIVVAFITGGLFVIRQVVLKRPCFDMGVFQFDNLRIGFLLFIIFYISRATLNICHSTMFSVWNWEPSRVAHVQYLNVIGNLIGMITAGFILAKGLASRYAFMLGFFLLAVYHLWFTFLFVPDAALRDIALPYTIQGMAVGVLFVPLVLFTVSSVPVEYAPFSGTVGVSGRFWGSTIGFCIMQNAQVFLQKKHYTKLSQSVLWESPETQERISQYTNSFIAKGYATDDAGKLAIRQVLDSLSKQSVLLGNMEIFTALGYVLLLLTVLLLFNKHLKQTFDIFKNRVWGS
ncbi:MFS transporter [Flavobacterium sp. NRK F10]|uniref:MFS transporter n=1 Tax=Flavobacterium sediminis TaxID=2201181 RepID=A0A2U8QUL5_9FLAO|nr:MULTISPECIES: MFS transporter [Flavobacterium]AWM13887.1 MFS transporter [Flavobacterium sediminis]MCO6175056.1 MFS transporter [Flavobacterium sp. NRK F10]